MGDFFGHAQSGMMNCACPEVNSRRIVWYFFVLFFVGGREITANDKLKGDNEQRKKKKNGEKIKIKRQAGRREKEEEEEPRRGRRWTVLGENYYMEVW